MPDAREVVTPGILGLELGLEEARLQIRVVAADDVDVRAVARDPTVVAAVIAPFTGFPEQMSEDLTAAGIGIVSLSDLVVRGPARSFVAPLEAQADAVHAMVPEGTLCTAGASTPWGRAFVDTLAPDAELDGSSQQVAAEAGERGCEALVWAGDAREGAQLGDLLRRNVPETILVLGSAARTQGFAVDASLEVPALAVCACTDLSTSAEPEAQAFVHAYAGAHGLDAGPFASEGYDAGRLLAAALGREPTRAAFTAALAGIERYEGLAGPYVWGRGGDLREPGVRMYERVGLRWMEFASARVAPEATRE